MFRIFLDLEMKCFCLQIETIQYVAFNADKSNRSNQSVIVLYVVNLFPLEAYINTYREL